jgi:DNA polymerase III epsilon subunit-like protein
MSKYLGLDVETGGLEPKHSTLTVAFVIFSSGGEELDKLHLKLKHKEYCVTREALEINGIDLVKHDLEALPVEDCQRLAKEFLKKHSREVDPQLENKIAICKTMLAANSPELEKSIKSIVDSCTTRQHLKPVGSQVEADIARIKRDLLPEWESYVSYRYINLVSIAQFLADCDILPLEKFGLKKLADYFGIEFSPHDAEEDARASGLVYFKLRGLLVQGAK